MFGLKLAMELLASGDGKWRYWSWCDGRSSWTIWADMMTGPLELLELPQWHCSGGTIEDGRRVAREGRRGRKGGLVGFKQVWKKKGPKKKWQLFKNRLKWNWSRCGLSTQCGWMKPSPSKTRLVWSWGLGHSSLYTMWFICAPRNSYSTGI